MAQETPTLARLIPPKRTPARFEVFRTFRASILLRSAGLVVLLAALALGRWLCGAPPAGGASSASLSEWIGALGVTVLLWSGLLLLLAGDTLLRPAPRPPRPLW
ncbi:hypothetical protein [Novosphingobium pituita]|uniref:Uncharacterized protein n=1 Tax=Novosphingobium pituita TaxID=3056842 RepID=A0ABQ6P2V5_9SPHN|nr:hypothetical protein [Novosphingobium sp. IK01]GMM59583.1 hypothetical protein NUTIK01_03600 [Novosphingobium sp. IK01]